MKLAAVSLAGLALFLWPFAGGSPPPEAQALALAVACLALLVILESGARRLDSRGLALLAAVAAIDSALRVALVTGVGGFSPVWFLILCAGYVFGPSYGFLAGSSTLLVSAFATGGVGPWLPYQMFAAGWVGAAAGAAGLGWEGRMSGPRLLMLAATGTVTGFGFGALMDIQGWVAGFRGTPGVGWSPGMPPGQALANFGRYYLLTSAAYDAFRAAGNALVILLLGAPVIAGLLRIRRRLSFAVA